MTTLGETLALADLERDPETILARLRAEEPVSWIPSMNMWLVTRWDDVEFVDNHPELFSARTDPSFLARALGRNMLTLDPPESTRARTAMLPSFQPRGVSGRFAAGELPALADTFIDAIADRGEADLMADYAAPLASASLARVLGIDREGWEKVWEWCRGLCTDLANFEDDPELKAVGDRAREDLGAVLDRYLDRIDPDSDDCALADFVRARPEGGPLTRDEIINNVRLMISGGINEPVDGIGLLAMTVIGDPELRTRLAGNPSLWRRATEEALRLYTPVGTITRQACGDIVLGGSSIHAGDLVSGVLRSANLDESHWTDPTRFDIDRREGGHAAFALGDHRCLGEWLGRQEVRVGTQRLFERLEGLRLAPDADPVLTGFEFRGPTSLRVVWDSVVGP